jgi:hypothetical protein
MGYKARLADGSIIQPAVDVLAGRITPASANATYRGTAGVCVHCEKIRASHSAADDLTVSYVSATVLDDAMTRIMHFRHRPGASSLASTCPICRDVKHVHHAAALEVLSEWAAGYWPGAVITQELTIVAPGTPPERFIPDIEVRDHRGDAIACIEYQRSKESFLDFKRRHDLRESTYPDVWWIFDRSIYKGLRDHRRYLSDQKQTYFVSWVEKGSQRLILEHGRPDEGRITSPARDCATGACSFDAAIMKHRTSLPSSPIACNGVEVRGLVPRVKTVEAHIQQALASGLSDVWSVRRYLERQGIIVPTDRIRKALRDAVGTALTAVPSAASQLTLL